MQTFLCVIRVCADEVDVELGVQALSKGVIFAIAQGSAIVVHPLLVLIGAVLVGGAVCRI